MTYLAHGPIFKHIYYWGGQGIDFCEASTWTEELAVRLLLQVISKNISRSLPRGMDKTCPFFRTYWVKGILQRNFKSTVYEAKEHYSDFNKIKEIYKGVSG